MKKVCQPPRRSRNNERRRNFLAISLQNGVILLGLVIGFLSTFAAAIHYKDGIETKISTLQDDSAKQRLWLKAISDRVGAKAPMDSTQGK